MNIGELDNPHAQGPGSLTQPAGQESTIAAPATTRSPAQTSMSPEEQANLLEAQQGAGGAPQGNGLSPEEQADLLEAQQQTNPGEKQGPPERVPGLTQAYGLVKKPDGKYGIQEKSGNIRELSPEEKSTASKMAKFVKNAGPAAGVILSGAATLLAGQPEALPVTANIGGAVGKHASLPLTNFFEELAGEPKTPHDALETVRNLSGLAGGAASAALESKTMQSKMAAVVDSSLNNLRDKIGPRLTEQQLKDFSVKDVFKQIEDKLGSDVGQALDELAPHVRQRQFDATQLTAAMDAIETKYGEGLPTSLKRTFRQIRNEINPKVSRGGLAGPDKAIPEANRGMTFDRNEELRTTAGTNASFHKDNNMRDVGEKAWGEWYGATAKQRDTIVSKMAQEANDPNLSTRLVNANKAYSENIDDVGKAVKALAQNPTEAVDYLVKHKNPEFVKNIWNLLSHTSPQTQTILRARFADSLMDGDLTKNMAKYDPKILDTVLGGNRAELEKLGRIADVFPKVGKNPEAPGFKSAVQSAYRIIANPAFGLAKTSLAAAVDTFEGNNVAKKALLDMIKDKLPVDYANAFGTQPNNDLQRATTNATVSGSALVSGIKAKPDKNTISTLQGNP